MTAADRGTGQPAQPPDRPQLPAVAGPLGFDPGPLCAVQRTFHVAGRVVHTHPDCRLLYDPQVGVGWRSRTERDSPQPLTVDVATVLTGAARDRSGQPLRCCPCVLEQPDRDRRFGSTDPTAAWLHAGFTITAARTLIAGAFDLLDNPAADPRPAGCELLLAHAVAAAVAAADLPAELTDAAGRHADIAAAGHRWAVQLPHVHAARRALLADAARTVSVPGGSSWTLSGLTYAGERAVRAATDACWNVSRDTRSDLPDPLTLRRTHPDGDLPELVRAVVWQNLSSRDHAAGVAAHVAAAAAYTRTLAVELAETAEPHVYLVEDWRAVLTGAPEHRPLLSAAFGLHPVRLLPGTDMAALLLPEPVATLVEQTAKPRWVEFGPVPATLDWEAVTDVAVTLWREHGGMFPPASPYAFAPPAERDPLASPDTALQAAAALLSAAVTRPAPGPGS